MAPFDAVNERDGLAVGSQEGAGVDVDELEDGRVVLQLHRDREEILSVRDHDGGLEGAADGLGGDGRLDGECHRLT